jgi:hypothetical protein
MVTLLQRSADGWGYKSMDEDSGPYYWDIPFGWLADLDPPATQFSNDWRIRVFARALGKLVTRKCRAPRKRAGALKWGFVL